MSDDNHAFYDVRDVKDAARGRWAAVLAGFGVDASRLRNAHGPCPGCGGKDRFRFDDAGGDGSFICSQGGGELLAGDGIALLMHCKGWEWKRCVQEMGAALGVKPSRGEWKGERSEAGEGVAPEPQGEVKKRPALDAYEVWEFTRGVPAITPEWLAARSAVDVESCETTGFLRALYRDDERVLVFLNEHSQGDFIARMPAANLGLVTDDGTVRTYRLAQQKGVSAVPSALPAAGPKGVWFLTNPVSGQWAINPRAKNREGGDEPKWSRRSAEMITSWRFFVLESDVLGEAEWLKVLANVQLPIAAIYTSGGRSIHALMECEVPGKAHWDALRDTVKQLLCPLGADQGALSAVRLSRLPGCKRGVGTAGKLQQLLYLNPHPDSTPIRLKPALR